ncbi:MAG: hypothetical protein Ta2G_15340 [Termitinemataceae bacterium]|nr:MAG: hypothetical protein Ta2G_15340 [Termitinemataceae bacterium]
MKKLHLSIFLLFLIVPVHALDTDVSTLMSLYLQNDIGLQEAALKVKQAELELGRAGIQTGINLEVSTGQLWISADENGGTFKISPNAKVSAPLLNNTSVQAQAEASGNSEASTLNNVGVSISTAIITNNIKKSKITKIMAERALLDAERALHRRSLQAEKEFYTALSDIYTAAVSAFTLEDDAYTKDIELQLAKIQGYGENSVHYRTILLESLGKKRDSAMQMREFERKKSEFFENCGIVGGEIPNTILSADENAINILQTLSDFSDQNDDKFVDINAAEWTHLINSLNRNADGDIELNVNGGFTFNNTSFDKTTSINAGLTFAWKGIAASLGTEIPISDVKKPALTLSVGLTLNTLRLAAIKDSEKRLQYQSEMLGIAKAEKAWRSTILDMARTKEDLIHESREKTEQAELYKILEADTTEYYKSGMINESDYKKAKTSALRAAYQSLLSDIKIIQYTIEYRLYFVD